MPQRDLESIYTEHSRMVYWAAYSVLRSDSDAMDVTQNVFLRTIKHMGKLAAMEEGQLKAWLYRVAVNLSLDIKRKQKREYPVDELPERESTALYDMPEPSAITAEQRRIVREAIERLPDIYREVVMLHYYSNMSCADIAQLTGAAEGTIKSRISRARIRLMELLKEGEKKD